MNANVRSVLLTTACVLIGAAPLSAAPVTWQASGQIGNIINPMGALNTIAIGTAWNLEITFNPDAAGVPQPCGAPSIRYAGAISETRFQLGAFEYTNAGGDIYTNSDLPVIGCSTPLGGAGLVQFQWLGGWTGGAGGPNLNLDLGLLLASYNDVNAAGGSLPTTPNPSAVQSALAGLEWDSTLGGPLQHQFTSSFNPQAVPPQPVPEPASVLLVGAGMTLLARRRWAHRHGAKR
jgi:hypothetical protein